MAEPWIAVQEVTNHLGVARDSVHRWIEKKGLPAPRMGRLWKFRTFAIDEWVPAGGASKGVSNGFEKEER